MPKDRQMKVLQNPSAFKARRKLFITKKIREIPALIVALKVMGGEGISVEALDQHNHRMHKDRAAVALLMKCLDYALRA